MTLGIGEYAMAGQTIERAHEQAGASCLPGRSIQDRVPQQWDKRRQLAVVALAILGAVGFLIVLTGWDANGASFLLAVNPLVVWLWISGVIVLAGTIFAMWPRPRPRAVRAAEPEPAPRGVVAYGD